MVMDKEDNDMCKEAQGTEINWSPGKNVTVKTIKKKQKHKSSLLYSMSRVQGRP